MTIAQPPLRRTFIALATTAVLALSGCGGDEPSTSGPSASESSASGQTSTSKPANGATQVDVTIEGDDVTPVAQAVQIGVGETVVLNITSDRAGELHVHSSPEQELEFEAGSSQLQVTLDKPGSVDIEEHESDSLIVRVLVK
jgi:hypothetical protein